MRKISFYIFLLVFLIIEFSGCKSKPRIVNIQATWKSNDPLTIPLNMREKEFEKGNLVLNPSFENGRYFNIDSSRISFNLHAWKRAGENVYWTDVQNQKEFRSNEAYNGLHAIKIVRKNADETDTQGEGIISDFIKVIPGNYKLSFYIRLEQVESNLSRLINTLYEAVNVRLYFYDKNKVLIQSNIFNPGDNNYIDNSFKGFSFSNIHYINELGWGKALGKTAHFPFNEGDLPDDCRYVKIFLGLKGNGSMWVDMVDFRYSENNFTLKETTEALSDSLMPVSSQLIPAPHQSVNYSPQVLTISANEKSLDPVIIIPPNAETGILKAAENLSMHIGEVLRGNSRKPVSISIYNKLDDGMIESGRLIFSFGRTRALNENAGELPVRIIAGKPQSYFISILPSAKRLVIIGANDDEGYLHSGNTLIQLTDKETRTYHHYDIIDYPDVETRAFIFPVIQDISSNVIIHQIKTLSDAGFNRIYFQDGESYSFLPQMEAKVEKYTSLLSGIKTVSPKVVPGISLLNLRFRMKTGNENYLADIQGNSEITGRLMGKFSASGFNNFLLSDELVWDLMDMGSKSIVFNFSGTEKFEKFIIARNIFIDGIRNARDFKPAKRNILFFPVLSNNENLINSFGYSYYYFEDLQRHRNFFDGFLWEGPVDNPTQLDFAEIFHFKSQSRMPSYMFLNTLTTRKDNRLEKSYAAVYPGKARMGNIFEAFNVDLAESPELMGLPSFCLINQTENSAINRIRLMTAADYLWNKEAYNPFKSVWKALIKVYGKENAKNLIQFNDLYYQLLQLCMLMEKERQNQKNIKSGEDLILQLNNYWNEITVKLSREIDLLNELADLKNQVIARFYQVK